MKCKMAHYMIIRYPIHCRIITTKIKQDQRRNKHIIKRHPYMKRANLYKKDIYRKQDDRYSTENRINNMHRSTVYRVTPKRNRKTKIQQQ